MRACREYLCVLGAIKPHTRTPAAQEAELCGLLLRQQRCESSLLRRVQKRLLRVTETGAAKALAWVATRCLLMVDAAMEELEVEVVARFLPDVVDGC